jgi:putative protease
MEAPELLIPAGNMLKLKIALAYGADAVYVGAAGFSMRPDEAAFTVSELAEAVELAHKLGRRLYVGINSLAFGADLLALAEWLAETKNIAFDAMIVADPGVFTLVREKRPDVEVHISTQLSTANTLAARFWQDAGAARVVLAREATLADAAEIAAAGVPVEVFVHGAMCVAVSGRCLLSAHLVGKSGNRGVCKHTCRWEWQLVEQKHAGSSVPIFETGKETIFLGSTDLCLLEHLPKLIEAQVASLKVEGRMKGEYYVGAVTRAYRAALDAYFADPAGYEFNRAWQAELESVSHRPYDVGFAFGYPEKNPERLQIHNSNEATHQIAALVLGSENGQMRMLTKNPFRVGEKLEWIGPEWSGGNVTISLIVGPDGRSREAAHCGTEVIVELSDRIELPDYAILRQERNV